MLLGYGGSGSGCVREYSRSHSWPAVFLDTHVPELTEQDPFLDSVELSNDAILDEVRLRNLISGYKNILLVSSLGGESFEYAYGAISSCAASLGVSIVSLCTIPYYFESERRKRALENLDFLSDTVSNLFVIDLQKTIRDDCPVDDFLTNTRLFLLESIRILADLMECGPFQTYCDNHAYTLASGTASLYSDAVHDALGHPLCESKEAMGKVLVCTKSGLNPLDLMEVQSQISEIYSVLPEFIHSDAVREHSVMLFIPISFRRHG